MASHYKSEFLANVSHELRTPLNAIIGYSEMLMEEAGGREMDEFIPDLKRIHTSGIHLLTIISDILDLSKIEAGKLELTPESFPVENMVHDVAGMVKPLAEKYGNSLEIKCEIGLGQMYADPTRVRQILFNILSNACKFTERGSVKLNAARIPGKDHDWLIFRVEDTGIGMTADHMAKLFQPFARITHKGEKKYDGTGLGLVITKQFCNMMGGEIRIKSDYGSGTTVTLKLPLNVQQAGTVDLSSFHG
jgi:signal transduction histidine kinase